MPETFEAPSQPLVDGRQAAFARLVASIVDALNEAVDHRTGDGSTRKEISEKIGCDRSALTRTLRGEGRNLTLKTISDILWACDYEPEEFLAEPIEEILKARAHAHNSMSRSIGTSIIQTPQYVIERNMIISEDFGEQVCRPVSIKSAKTVFSQ